MSRPITWGNMASKTTAIFRIEYYQSAYCILHSIAYSQKLIGAWEKNTESDKNASGIQNVGEKYLH